MPDAEAAIMLVDNEVYKRTIEGLDAEYSEDMVNRKLITKTD